MAAYDCNATAQSHSHSALFLFEEVQLFDANGYKRVQGVPSMRIMR
jgi:hypothetical protein